jgi:hypothetical protein
MKWKRTGKISKRSKRRRRKQVDRSVSNQKTTNPAYLVSLPKKSQQPLSYSTSY